VTPIELTEVIDRLCGEYEITFDPATEDLWRDSLKSFDKDQCMEAIANSLAVFDAIPTIASFRLECIKAGQRNRPRQECGCLNGWELPDESNFAIACRRCSEGEIRAAATEAYRSERADLRRRIRTPELLKERVADADSAARWAEVSRDALKGVPA
jgi:hypothetical protein